MKIVAGSPVDDIELPFSPPFDWGRMLRFFGGRSTGGVETVDANTYFRTIKWSGASGLLSVRCDTNGKKLIANVQGEASRHLEGMERKLSELFDTGIDPEAMHASLSQDPWLDALVTNAPGLRIPGAWSGFELVIRTIVGQQVSVKAATTIVGRLVQRTGQAADIPLHPDTPWQFPTPGALASANLEGIGMPTKRVQALQGFAQAVADGTVDIDGGVLDLRASKNALLALPGIGPWTVEYVAMRAWRDTDAWPGTDLVLMQAIAKRFPDLIKNSHQLKYTEAWRPWRAYAAMHLWNEIADIAGSARGG